MSEANHKTKRTEIEDFKGDNYPRAHYHPSEKQVVATINLYKSFGGEKEARPGLVRRPRVTVLREINLIVKPAQFVILYGPSGCGKSTLLHCIVGLEKPTKGEVWIRGKNIYTMTEDERSEFRARHIGIVYQQPLWISSLYVVENVALPVLALGEYERTALRRAKHILGELGLEKLAYHYPLELSGGEQQLVGVARALATNPWLIVLDEPTGNLDSHSSDRLLATLQQLNRKSKRTILLVTHNLAYLPYADRAISMRDGRLIKEATDEEVFRLSEMARNVEQIRNAQPLGKDNK